MTQGDAGEEMKRPVRGRVTVQGLCAACSLREDEQTGGASPLDSPMPSMNGESRSETEGRLLPAAPNY